MNARTLPNDLFGIAERFPVGDDRHVKAVLEHMEQLGVRHLRLPIAWSDLQTISGRAWYEWLFPTLAAKTELLPCFSCNDAGALEPEKQARLFNEAIRAFGPHFSAVELWTSTVAIESDPRLDPVGASFVQLLDETIQHLRDTGKHVVLGGAASAHNGWLELLGARGLLREIDAIAMHGPITAAEIGSRHWQQRIERTRDLLSRHGSDAELWITETGFAHNGAQDRTQIRAFLEAMETPAHRLYWHNARDHASEHDHESSALFEQNGTPRLLARLLQQGGPARLRELITLSQPGPRRSSAPIALITGGAGFIGTNLAARLLSEGRQVRIFDNLTRAGTEENLHWLWERWGDQLEFRLADVRSRSALRDAVADASEVYHFAAQVAVTTSLVDPIHDFEINGRGTLNLLEELRRLDKPPTLLFTSTNKVYGGLEDLPLHVNETRYELANPLLRERGIDESRPLAFCSPYGCSKGASDQYVVDFARTFHLPAAVLRMSCIYGPHQRGTEDQGWVAHFERQALARKPIIIYGDGRQVRDILFVNDLIDAMLLARDHMDALRGQAFNIGGGPQNSVSLRELLRELERLHGKAPEVRYESWRASDQRYYVSDVSRFSAATGWSPRTSVSSGIAQLHAWLTGQSSAAAKPSLDRIVR